MQKRFTACYSNGKFGRAEDYEILHMDADSQEKLLETAQAKCKEKAFRDRGLVLQELLFQGGAPATQFMWTKQKGWRDEVVKEAFYKKS